MGIEDKIKGAKMSNMNVAENADILEKRQSAMRRRSSMFEVDLDRRGRGDSIISVNDANGSILDMQRRRKNYENTYKTEPDEKPQMKLVRETITDIINVTCDGLETNQAFHMGLTTTLNSEVHARLKKIIPKRHRFVVQTFLIEHNDQDIQIGSKWLWNPEHDDHVTITKTFSTFSIAVNAHFLYIE